MITHAQRRTLLRDNPSVHEAATGSDEGTCGERYLVRYDARGAEAAEQYDGNHCVPHA